MRSLLSLVVGAELTTDSGAKVKFIGFPEKHSRFGYLIVDRDGAEVQIHCCNLMRV